MTSRNLRITMGAILVISHFIILCYIVALTVFDKYTHDQMFSLIGIILPLFSAYTTIIVTSFMNDQGEALHGDVVSTPKAIVSLSIPSLFVLFLFFGITWKAFGTLGIDNLIKFVGVVETAFGVYVGVIIKSLFPDSDS